MSVLRGDHINITNYGRLLYLGSFNLLQPEQLKTKLFWLAVHNFQAAI